MRFIAQIIGVVSTCFVVGCVSSTIRLPASFKPKYNTKIVTSLRNAAVNGVLFQVSDSVFRDVPARQVDRCRKAEEPGWSAQLLSMLEVLDTKPQYYNKFHIIDIKRGDKPRVEIVKDIYDATYLTITYTKRETREKVGPGTVVPCMESNFDYQGKDLVTTNIDWPNIEEFKLVLNQAPVKQKLANYEFNTDFLVYLAERQTVLKMSPEVPFAKRMTGEPFLKYWLDTMAQELPAQPTVGQKEQPAEELEFINYWLKEIATHSKQANMIQFFGLHQETGLSYGVQVDTVGKFSRKLANYQEPTYLFVSFGERKGEPTFSHLKDLNKCLQTLLGIYGNPLAMSSTLESDENSFLAPGYSCKLDIPD